jgi:hypothetical protein
MRKFLGVLALSLLLLGAALPVALGQEAPPARDPFVPLIGPSPTATGVAPTSDPAPTDPVDPDPEPLPDTGSSTSSWFGVGYVLVAFGAGALVLSRVYGPLRG